MSQDTGFLAAKRKPRPLVIVVIVLLHVLLFYGLVRALAPDFTASVEDSVVSAFTVTVTAPPEEPPKAEEPDEGAQGDPGKEAVPKPVTAPEPKIPVRKDPPAPKASSTGTASSSGARDSGEGTGASGTGEGTGSGNSGGGQGGGIATKAVKTRGDIANVRDYPIPPGGRQARIGTSVTIAVTVGTDGLPKSCRVIRAGPFPETNQRTCELAMQRFRFEPARDRNGNPVVSEYGWRQDFFN